MDNDNSQPLLIVGVMPNRCYEDANDFANELAKILRIPIDTIQVIKGAKGEDGKKGDPGQRGVKGEIGPQGAPGQRTFADVTALGLATPDFIGQLAVVISPSFGIYLGASITVGDWEIYGA